MKNCILVIFLFFASNYLWAEEEPSEKQSLHVLQSKVESYMLNELANYSEGKVSVVAGKMDQRLKLKTCADDHLEIFNPYDTPLLNTNTMGVKCTEKDVHWTLYIPIKVSILKTVLLTKNARKKGEKLTADDLYQTEMDAQKLKQGYFTDAKQLIGLVCKKDIAADTPITPYNIELEKLVLRGQEVSINASSGTLSIKMGGTALSDGALGDVIKVKNTTSKRVIDAQVSGKQTVNVAM